MKEPLYVITGDTVKQAIDSIRKEKYGDTAVDVLNISSYLAPENIPITIFSDVANKEELEAAIELLEQYFLVHANLGKGVLNVSRLIQESVRACQEKCEKELVLKRTLFSLLENENELEDAHHIISVWNHANEYPKLINEFSDAPNVIVGILNHNDKHKESFLFASKQWDLLQHFLGEKHIDVLKLRNNIALILSNCGEYQEALNVFQEVYKKLQKVKNIHYECILLVQHNIAFAYANLVKFKESLAMYKEVFEMRKIILGVKHPDTLLTQSNMAVILSKHEKRHIEAFNILEDVYNKQKEMLGPNDPATLTTQHNIGSVLLEQGKYEESVTILNEVFDKRKRILGVNHSLTIMTRSQIAQVLLRQSKYDEGIKILQETLKVMNKSLGPEHPETLRIKSEIEMAVFLSKTLNKQKRPDVPKNAVQMRPPMLLHSAVSDGDLSKVRSLIENEADINCKDDTGRTPLHCAAEFGYLNIVRLLLESGAVYNAKNAKGITPAQLANSSEVKSLFDSVDKIFSEVKSRNYDQVTVLVTETNAIVNAKDSNGCTLLHWSVSSCCCNIVKLLLENGADAIQASNKGNTPLHIAALKGNKDIVDVLLQNVSHEKLNYFLDLQTAIESNMPVHVAAKNGFLEVICCLLKYGARYNAKNKNGKVPSQLTENSEIKTLLNVVKKLFHSVKAGNKEQLSECIASKSTIINSRDEDGCSPLHLATYNGDQHIVKMLLSGGADVTQLTTAGATSLHIAASIGNNGIIELLLQYTNEGKLSYFINAETTTESNTALHIAAKNGFLEIVKTLLKHGAIYNAKNKVGKSPFQLSENNKVKNIFKELIKLFNDVKAGNYDQIVTYITKQSDIVNARDNGSYSLLHWASFNCHLNVVKVLLASGADATQCSDKGNTPLHLAASKGNSEIVETLLKYVSQNKLVSRNKLRDFINFKTTDGGNTAFQIAAQKSCPKVITSLLKHGAFYNTKNRQNKTAFELANNSEIKNILESVEKLFQDAKAGNYDAIADKINKENVILNAMDSDGISPLHWAVYCGHQNIVELLLKGGCKVTQVSNKGNTALHIAVSKGNKEIVELLIEYISKDELVDFINAETTAGGNTPLHIAAKNGFLDIFITLLNNGAIHDKVNKKGKVPLEISTDQRISNLLNACNELSRFEEREGI